MQKVVHRAATRGQANHGWLKSAHSFSFASYFNPQRMGFGLLRVLNDDFVAPGYGFDTHPHRDMEIVSIPLAGSLQHKDSEGHEQTIKYGEVQLMSAGTGVFHSEYNGSTEEPVNFLQIWVMPEKKGIKPRYDQKEFSAAERHNKLQTIVAPIGDASEGIKINQQAYFSLVDLEQGKSLDYRLQRPGNGLYVFVLQGEAKVAGEILGQRDAIGVSETPATSLQAVADSKLLLIDVPMA